MFSSPACGDVRNIDEKSYVSNAIDEFEPEVVEYGSRYRPGRVEYDCGYGLGRVEYGGGYGPERMEY